MKDEQKFEQVWAMNQKNPDKKIKELCEELGVNYNNFYNWKRRKKEPVQIQRPALTVTGMRSSNEHVVVEVPVSDVINALVTGSPTLQVTTLNFLLSLSPEQQDRIKKEVVNREMHKGTAKLPSTGTGKDTDKYSA